MESIKIGPCPRICAAAFGDGAAAGGFGLFDSGADKGLAFNAAGFGFVKTVVVAPTDG